jgi:type IV secretory pathway VirD2 relaxase
MSTARKDVAKLIEIQKKRLQKVLKIEATMPHVLPEVNDIIETIMDLLEIHAKLR